MKDLPTNGTGTRASAQCAVCNVRCCCGIPIHEDATAVISLVAGELAISDIRSRLIYGTCPGESDRDPAATIGSVVAECTVSNSRILGADEWVADTNAAAVRGAVVIGK